VSYRAFTGGSLSIVLNFRGSAGPREPSAEAHVGPPSDASRGAADPDVTYIIAQPCIGTKDASCVDVCPVDCIYEGEDQYYIHPEECIDCGACVPECPVEAIFPDYEVPDEWKDFIAENYTHFDMSIPS
jgi:NAD-dependent dihydropyrimidine dehydrogenase PreA subunit